MIVVPFAPAPAPESRCRDPRQHSSGDEVDAPSSELDAMAATVIGPTGARWTAPARWVVTGVATVVSVFTLDIAATATGVLLVASHAFDGLSHAALIAFLVASYLPWAAVLRVNLIANWRLLEEIGTSTNLVSKALFEMARVRSGSQRRGQRGVGGEVPRHRDRQGGAVLPRRLRNSTAQRRRRSHRGPRLPRRHERRRCCV